MGKWFFVGLVLKLLTFKPIKMESTSEYVSVQEAVKLLGTTRQNIFYLRKNKILTDFKVVHATCILYSRTELLILKSRGYGK